MKRRSSGFDSSARQSGMALLISLIMLLLLTMIGISSMQNATMQEKMSGSVMNRNQSFQVAEASLRVGEYLVSASAYTLAKCASVAACAPPTDSSTISAAGAGANGINWSAAATGLYAIQNIGSSSAPVNTPSGCSTQSAYTLYRITGVALVGSSRSIVESIYAKCSG
jgi:type IV pilus assembly protein PilX